MSLGQAPQSFLFGSISGSWVAFALFGGIAAGAGIATAAMLRRFAARSGELPYYGTSAVARSSLGAIVGSAILALVWWWLWSGFYRIEVGRDVVTLQFYVPSRERVLQKQDILAARWDAAPRASRVLVVETRSGKVYRSMQTSANDAFERRVTQAVGTTDTR